MSALSPNDLRSIESRLDGLRNNLIDARMRLSDQRNFLRGAPPPEASRGLEVSPQIEGYIPHLHSQIQAINEIVSDINALVTQIVEV